MKIRKTGLSSRIISGFLAFVMIVAMVPMVAPIITEAASNLSNGFEGQDADIFSALGFDTSELPEGYDAESTDNPYGRDTILGDQVFEAVISTDSATAIYGNGNNNVAASSINSIPGSGTGIGMEMYAASPGDFDGDGLAGEIVYVGYDTVTYNTASTTATLRLKIHDAKTGTAGTFKDIGAVHPGYSTSGSTDTYSIFDYVWQNYLQVATGDWDGDGTAEIAVYVAENGNARVDIFKYQKTSLSGASDWLDMANWDRVWTHVLSNTAKETPNMVSLASGDFNRDGIDDLAISSGRLVFRSTVSQNEIDASSAVILWGATNDMLQSYIPVDLNEKNLGSLTRVSLTTGDLDGDGYKELIATGQPISDVRSSADPSYSGNTTRSITTYLYDSDMGLVINYSGLQKPLDGKTVTLKVDEGTSTGWQSANGFDGTYNSYVGMRTNAAAFRPQGSDYTYLYLDSCLYQYVEGQLNLMISLDDESYDGENTLGGDGYWGIDGEMYMEYGVVAADINGKGYDTLLTSFYHYRSGENTSEKHRASFGTLYADSDGVLDTQIAGNSSSSATLNTVALAMADVDVDTVIIKYTGEHYLTYSDPKVYAVIAAAPYFEDIDEVTGYNYAWQNSTSYSRISGDIRSDSTFVDLEVGGWVDSDIKVGGGKVVTTFSALYTLEWTEEKVKTTEYNMVFETEGGEDAVAFYSIPTENYVYAVYTPDGNGGYIETKDIISNAFAASYQTLSLDYYESIQGNYSKLPKIKGVALESTPGDPSSYPSSARGYDVVKQWNDKTSAVSFGNGSVSQEITVTEEEGDSYNMGAAIDFELGGGAEFESTLTQSEVDMTGGLKFSLNPGDGWADFDITGNSYTGTVANMPEQFRDYGYFFNWRLFVYNYKFKDGTSIPVVSYVVSDVSAPPSLPEDFGQDFDRTTSDKNVLTWTYDDTFSKFNIYKYYDFPVGGGLQLVSEIPSDTADYKVKYDDAGKPYKEYFFEDTNLSEYTEYKYAIQVERLSEVPPLSSPSALMTARTKALKGTPLMSITESDGEDNGQLLVYPDKTSYITVNVTGPDGETPSSYYTTVQYQWQKNENGVWTDLVGETGLTMTFASAGVDTAGEYRCRVNSLTKSDATAITSYTDSVILTHSKRSSYVSEIYVQDVSGGGVELFVKLSNGHSDSAAVPGGDVTFSLTNNATGDTYQFFAKLNAAGVANAILEDSLPEGMYSVYAYYSGSFIFKSSSGETLYLSQRGSGYDVDVVNSYVYGEGAEAVFRYVTKSAGITSVEETAAGSYTLLAADAFSVVKLEGATAISEGGTAEIGKTYYITVDEVRQYFTATHSGKITVDGLYVVYGTDGDITDDYITYTNEGGKYEIAEDLPAGGYVLKMYGDSDEAAYGGFTVERRPITIKLPTYKTGEGTSAEGEPTDAPSVPLSTLEVISGSWADCDMTDGVLNSSLGNLTLWLDYVNTAGKVFSRWSVDALCGYYTVVYQDNNDKRFPNYDITCLDGVVTVLGATREIEIGARPFEGQAVGTLYAVSPDYDYTRADLSDSDALMQEHATGTRLVFTAVPDEGYEIYDWYVNGVSQGTKDTSMVYTVLAENATVEVQFAIKLNPLIFETAGDEGGGTIVCNDPDLTSGSTVLANGYFTFTAKAKEGYHFKEWRYTEFEEGTIYDDTDNGKDESTFELLMPGVSCSVYAVFERDFYTFTYSDKSGLNGLCAWYMGSTTSDSTAVPEKIYIENGDSVKGDSFITVEPKAGYTLNTKYTFVSEGSNGTADYDAETFTLTLTEDTTVSTYTLQQSFDVTLGFDVETNDVFPEGTAIVYTVGDEQNTFEYTGDADSLTIEDVPGGSTITAEIVYPEYYILDGFTNVTTMVTATDTLDRQAVKIELYDEVEAGGHYYYSENSSGMTKIWYFVSPVDGKAEWNGNAVTVYAAGNLFEIDAIDRDETVTVHMTEKPVYTVSVADISGKGTYSLEIPDGSYNTDNVVTLHEGDTFTILITPTQKWTVSYWQIMPESASAAIKVRATSLKYQIPAVTEDFVLTPIFSSSTYNTVSWPTVSYGKNGLTLSPLSGYLSSVSQGADFEFSISGSTVNMISQVFVNGSPFVEEGSAEAGDYTYTGAGADRTYRISDITENKVITVEMIPFGVTVNGVDIGNMSGTGWSYDPNVQVLSLTKSSLIVSGSASPYAPGLTIKTGSEVLSVVFKDLTLDPASGTSTNRKAVTVSSEIITITATGNNFIEGAILGGNITMRGTGQIEFENNGSAPVAANDFIIVGNVTVRLDVLNSNTAANISGTLSMGNEDSSDTASPTLKANGLISTHTVETYVGEMSVDSPTYAIMASTINNYGGIMNLEADSYVVYIDNLEGGTGWRSYSSEGYVYEYSKGDADSTIAAKTRDQYTNDSYDQVGETKKTGLNGNNYLRFDAIGDGNSIWMELNYDGYTYRGTLEQLSEGESTYYYIDPNDPGRINAVEFIDGTHVRDSEKASMDNWKIIAWQDKGGLYLQAYSFSWGEPNSTGGGLLVTYPYTVVKDDSVTYRYTLGGVSRDFDVLARTANIDRLDIRDLTMINGSITIHSTQRLGVYGDNYIYNVDGWAIDGSNGDGLQLISDGFGTLVAQTKAKSGALSDESLNIHNMKSLTALSPKDTNAMIFWGSWFRMFFYDSSNNIVADGYEVEAPAWVNYGTGWLQDMGDSPASAKTLDDYEVYSTDSYVKIYGTSYDAASDPASIVYDREGDVDTPAFILDPPMLNGTMHHVTGAEIIDANGESTELTLNVYGDPDKQPEEYDIYYNGYFLGQYMSLHMENGPNLKALPDGEYTLKINFRDPDPYDATFYYLDIPVTVTHASISDGMLAVNPVESVASRGQSVVLETAYAETVPSHYKWYVDDVEVIGADDAAYVYTAPIDAEIGKSVKIFAEAYDGNTRIGYATAYVEIVPRAEDIEFSADGLTAAEDGTFSVILGDENVWDFNDSVILDSGEKTAGVTWSLWGNVLRSTAVDSETGVLTVDPDETGTDGILRLIATYVNRDGSIYEEMTVIYISGDAGRGDVNGDGLINSLDISILIRVISGTNANAGLGADVNEDGRVTTIDLTLLKRKVAGVNID